MRRVLALLSLLLLVGVAPAAEPPPLAVLFLGDAGHHQPMARFRQLQPVFAARGISLTYTDKLDDLNPTTLVKFDGLMVFANHTKFTSPDQEKALLDYVSAGKGFIPVHCASYCFIDSKPYVDLVGGQFRSHATGVFRVEQPAITHPILTGFQSFESWDETYVHTKHNEAGRTVLEYRSERDVKEPWTWVRDQGKGRVFYTAWGHDQRTWAHPGFANLLERGTRWACGQDPKLAGVYVDAPKMTPLTGTKADFEYAPAKIPFYMPSKASGSNADPVTTMQKPLSPEISVKHYTTPVGFEMKLFAADDQFGGKPICMTWDERGRLWAAVTIDYPNELQPAGEGRDKIVILEDTNGDGKADKVTVFADKLSIPTSILHAHGGLIVHQAPHTLFLKDTNGDDKADVRQILFTGWGTQDTHAGPSNLRYGFDNWIYGSVGYSGFNGEIDGERLNFRQGYYRFKLTQNGDALTVTKLEFLRSTSNNTWGLAFDEDGRLFGSTANGCALVHMPIANRYYEKVRGLTAGVLPPINLDNRIHPISTKVRQVDWHGGFTAAANCAIYTARTYPPEYWNKTAFVSEPTGNLTATFVLQPTGSDFTARYGWNLVAADDEWAAPIDAQVGPDGHMWVLDWYNFIVQHNPTPQGFKTGKGNAYETELRDKTHGRVYRIVYTGAKPEAKVDLKGATPEALVELLKHPNMLWRVQAQRLLVERGKDDVVVGLLKHLEQPGDAGDYPGALHAIATLQGLKSFNISAARLQLKNGFEDELHKLIIQAHYPAAVRRELAAALATWPSTKFDGLLADWATTDPDPTVRVAGMLALTDRGKLVSGDSYGKPIALALAHPDFGTDANYRDAVTIAAATHPAFVRSLGAVKTPTPAAIRAIELAVSAAARTQKPWALEPDEIFPALASYDPAVVTAVIAGLADGWPTGRDPKMTPKGDEAIAALLTKMPPAARGRLLKLAAGWGSKGLDAQLTTVVEGLLATVADVKASDADRLDAAKQVIEFRSADEAAAHKLLDALTTQTSPALASGIVETLATSKVKTLGPLVVAKLPTLPPTVRPVALRLVLARPESTKAFLDAVEAGTLRFDVLALDQKTALSTHPDKVISERAKKLLALGGGLPDPDRQKVIDAFHPILAKSGDVGSGKKLFTQHCAKCHKHTGEGQQIGPDLTGFAVHPKEEILIHVLDPSRSVEGNYKNYTAKLLDGRVLQGLLAGESKTAIELLDAENKRHPISRDDLEELTESKKSLMPEGFEKQMTAADMTDLLEFLTKKGKYVPIPLDKVATVVTTKGMFFTEDSTIERMIFRDWSPKTFHDVPFYLIDPQGEKLKNAILLNSPNGLQPPKMPKTVTIPCNTPAKAIHLLGGVGGWAATSPNPRGTVSMTVRLHYLDGKTEDHDLKDGVHIADYIRRIDVPGSEFAFALRGQQLRYLAITPKRPDSIKQIEFVKGPDRTAPIIMAVTVETP